MTFQQTVLALSMAKEPLARDSENSEFPDLLIRNLAHALYWVDECLQATLEQAGWARMHRTKSMIMLNIAYGVTRPINLAKNLGVSRQAIHQTLQELQGEGLIELVEDPKDKRAKVAQFAEEAKPLRHDVLNALLAIESRVAEQIGERNLQSLKKSLNKDWGAIEPLKIPRSRAKASRAR